MNNKNGIIHILITYFFMFIPEIEMYFFNQLNKDLLLICFIISLLIITDAKMKYNSSGIKIAFYSLWGLFIYFFGVFVF